MTRTSRLRSSPPGRLSFWRPACLEYKVYYLAVTRTASSVFLGTGWRGEPGTGLYCAGSSEGIARRSRTLGASRRPRRSAGCASCFLSRGRRRRRIGAPPGFYPADVTDWIYGMKETRSSEARASLPDVCFLDFQK